MHKSQQKPLSFIEHLSRFMNEAQDTKDDDLEEDTPKDYREKFCRVFNDITHHTGEALRIFQNVDFHISPTDERMPILIGSYSDLYKLFHSKDKNRFNFAREFICNILMHFASPDLVNPDTSLLKDELLEVLGYKKDFDEKSPEQQMLITEYVVNAYLFYFFSGIFTYFENSNDASKSNPVNLDHIQKELVTFENLVAIERFINYIKDDTKSHVSRFTVAQKLILESVETYHLNPHGYSFENSVYHKLMQQLLDLDPDIRDQIQQCDAFYHMLGKDYVTAVTALLTTPEHTPEKTRNKR